MKNNSIFCNLFNIKEQFGKFLKLIRSKKGKWCLIRSQRNFNYIIELCQANKIAYLQCTSKLTEIAITREAQEESKTLIQCLLDRPSKPTVVLIKGRLRAGKVVPKKHIGFVWEDSRAPKTDTILQGLLGRMCGYEGNEWSCLGSDKPEIYLPESQIIRTGSIYNMSPLERYLDMPDGMPKRARNLIAADSIDTRIVRTSGMEIFNPNGPKEK